MPSLQELDYFLAVVDTGSLTRAADRCGISVPAMSKAMKRLETTLDARLFARGHQALRLTESGQLLAARARTIQSEWRLGQRELTAFQSRPSGRVSISASAAFARTLLLPRVPAFKARYPDVVLDIRLDDRLVDLSTVDLAIRVGLVQEQGVIARPLVPLGIRYAAHRDLWRTHRPPRSPEDLRRLPLIGFRLPSSSRLMPWQFQRDNEIYTLDLAPTVIANDPEAVLDLIRAGVGVGLVNAYLSQPLIDSGELSIVLADHMPPSERGTYLCYQSREHQPQKLKVVIDFLMAALAAPSPPVSRNGSPQ